MKPQLGLGMYDLAETARLTRLPASRIRRWYRPATQGNAPILCGDYSHRNGSDTFSFLDLVDLYVFGQLRTHGVSLTTLRKVYRCLAAGRPHPFAHARLASDGQDFFYRAASADGREELTEVLNRQRVFPEIIAPFLKQLDYDPTTHLAQRWRIADGVVLNPAIALGKPIVEGVFLKTEILAAAYRANANDADGVARWYNVSPHDVLRAVRFEAGLAA